MFLLINMHYDKEPIKKYLQGQVTLNTVKTKLGLSDSQCRYLQSEFNNYIGNEYTSLEDALNSISLHLS